MFRAHPGCRAGALRAGAPLVVGRIMGWSDGWSPDGRVLISEDGEPPLAGWTIVTWHALPGATDGLALLPDEIVLLCEPAAQEPTPEDRFPHTCPSCGGEAYIGFSSVEHADGFTCRRRKRA